MQQNVTISATLKTLPETQKQSMRFSLLQLNFLAIMSVSFTDTKTVLLNWCMSDYMSF